MRSPPPASTLFPYTTLFRSYAFHSWIREAFATNMPYDRFVRSILTAQGEWEEQPAISWYWQFRDGGITELTEDVSQLFLGQRLDRKSTRLNSSHGYISYAVF